MPQINGARINEFFDIVRPMIEFKFDIVLIRSNNIFELQTTENIDVLLKVIWTNEADTRWKDYSPMIVKRMRSNILHYDRVVVQTTGEMMMT